MTSFANVLADSSNHPCCQVTVNSATNSPVGSCKVFADTRYASLPSRKRLALPEAKQMVERLAILVLLFAVMVMPVNAQSSSLPPTNMGKYVHQPGDNQYSPQVQSSRHADPIAVRRPNPGMQVAVYRPTPRIPKPDITLEPIAADEPVVQPGFPPMPDRADLPVIGGWSNIAPINASGSGATAGNNGHGSDNGAQSGSTHQHYTHVPAGAYIPQNEQGSHGYYKAQRSNDFYAAGRGGNPTGNAAGNGSPTQQSLNAMGKEPRLDQRADQGVVPEAPTPVAVKQATTQDLSLPDDEFSYKNSQQKSQSTTMLKQMGRQMLMNPLMQMSGMSSSMMSKAVHF
jgi:hypothetical protein